MLVFVGFCWKTFIHGAKYLRWLISEKKISFIFFFSLRDKKEMQRHKVCILNYGGDNNESTRSNEQNESREFIG